MKSVHITVYSLLWFALVLGVGVQEAFSQSNPTDCVDTSGMNGNQGLSSPIYNKCGRDIFVTFCYGVPGYRCTYQGATLISAYSKTHITGYGVWNDNGETFFYAACYYDEKSDFAGPRLPRYGQNSDDYAAHISYQC